MSAAPENKKRKRTVDLFDEHDNEMRNFVAAEAAKSTRALAAIEFVNKRGNLQLQDSVYHLFRGGGPFGTARLTDDDLELRRLQVDLVTAVGDMNRLLLSITLRNRSSVDSRSGHSLLFRFLAGVAATPELTAVAAAYIDGVKKYKLNPRCSHDTKSMKKKVAALQKALNGTPEAKALLKIVQGEDQE